MPRKRITWHSDLMGAVFCQDCVEAMCVHGVDVGWHLADIVIDRRLFVAAMEGHEIEFVEGFELQEQPLQCSFCKRERRASETIYH